MPDSEGLKQYLPVQACIYCGRPKSEVSELAKEHIIPFALGGPMVLPRSSCLRCAKVTGGIERVCCKSIFGQLRNSLGAPTRKPTKRPKTMPVVFHQGDQQTILQVDRKAYPFVTLIMPQLGACHWITGAPSRPGIPLVWRSYHAEKRTGASFPGQPPIVGPEIISIDLAMLYRLLCKIAHSYAVAEKGLTSHRWLLPPLILGQKDNFSDLVGGPALLKPPIPTHMGPTPADSHTKLNSQHSLAVEAIDCKHGRSFLTVTIQLFFDFTPIYRIIVAEIDPKTGASLH